MTSLYRTGPVDAVIDATFTTATSPLPDGRTILERMLEWRDTYASLADAEPKRLVEFDGQYYVIDPALLRLPPVTVQDIVGPLERLYEQDAFVDRLQRRLEWGLLGDLYRSPFGLIHPRTTQPRPLRGQALRRSRRAYRQSWRHSGHAIARLAGPQPLPIPGHAYRRRWRSR